MKPETPRAARSASGGTGRTARDATSSIRTKLLPPRLPANPVALDRHRQWIEPILVHRLCLVRAPSGYGKSTLCTAWYHALVRQGHHAGWVSFQREDDELARAIGYIFEAVRGTGLKNPLVYDGLTPPQSLATQFVNAIFDFKQPFILFLDDLDRLTDPRILQFLNFVLLHCPENLHIVCACQRYPALPLVWLDTHEMLLRVGTDELRLSDKEAQELFTINGSELEKSEVRRLNEAMAGWVTGLRIGYAALRNSRDALFDIGLISRGAHWLSDYLDENIFQHLTPVTRQFLMRCAVVEVMTADLCQALSGESGAAQMLAWLADQNLFIQRLDDTGTRFRVHPVFREFLLTRLKENASVSVAQLHRTASDWFAAHDQVAEAISHAFDAGATDQAAALIDIAAMSMVEHSDIVTLLDWIARLPEAAIAAHLSLRLAEAWALTLSLRPQARALIDQLARRVDDVTDPAEQARLRLELVGIEAVFLAVYEDRLDAAVKLGYGFIAAPSDEASLVSRAFRNLTAYCEVHRGNMHLVHDLLRPSELIARHNEQIFPTAYRYYIVGLGLRTQGELAEAERILLHGLKLAEQRAGRQSASASLVAAGCARSVYERGDLNAAAALLQDRLPILDEAAFHEAVIDAYGVLIRIAALGGKLEQAVTLIERAELIGHERCWRRLLANCMLERTRLRLPLTTDPDRLAPDQYRQNIEDGLLSLDQRTFVIVAEARCLEALIAGDRARFEKNSEWLLKIAQALKNDPLALRVRLLGIAAAAKDNPASMLEQASVLLLERALSKGYRRTLLDGLTSIGVDRLRGLLKPYDSLRPLLRGSEANPAESPRVSGGESETVFTILTSREIDVLTGVGRGDSNKEIARRLHLTHETVKWHLKNVMRKLNAETRAEAVQHASALGLSLTSE